MVNATKEMVFDHDRQLRRLLAEVESSRLGWISQSEKLQRQLFNLESPLRDEIRRVKEEMKSIMREYN